MKNGQVSVFVIIGIIILIIVGFSVFIFSKSDSGVSNVVKNKNQKDIISNFENLLYGCIDESVREGLYVVSERGGFYEAPILSREVYYYDINPFSNNEFVMGIYPYYMYSGAVTMPSLEELEFEYSKFSKDYFVDCVSKLSFFNESGLNFSLKDDVVFNLYFGEKAVLVDLNYPLIVYFDDGSFQFSSYERDFNYDISSKFLIIKEFIAMQSNNVDYVNSGFLAGLASENKFKFESTQLGKDVLFTFIFDDFIKENGFPLKISFVLQFNEVYS
ncbi:hypothetical protein K9L67_02470 [Candidatus Woesearchaeota archaeon]|nr:hypothetical protein [Candidatus Woesearchaeota archaeon]MCF7901070.1 hypothetical protein [Candidatus Woesearchaeota archaeon]MCF8013621.1 hypothetical protein [Candidatus Woesearchaeota archaeon]